MKTLPSRAVLAASILALAVSGFAAEPSSPKPPLNPPPPVRIAPPSAPVPGVPAPGATPHVYEQRINPGRPMLVSPEQAKGIIERFRATYKTLGSPKLLIYVNRELVDDKAGMRLSARSEKTVASRNNVTADVQADPNGPKEIAGQNTTTVNAGGNVTVVTGKRTLPGKGTVATSSEQTEVNNTYTVKDRAQGTLADKMTVRDVERLFGRPLRMAGVSLADQRTATQLIGDKPLQNFTTPTEGEAARKDREALGKIADIVLEVLISSRTAVVPGVSGDQAYTVPDISATAIRLSDSKIMGQASVSDIIGKDAFAGHIFRNFDVKDMAEATALALMEDLVNTGKQ